LDHRLAGFIDRNDTFDAGTVVGEFSSSKYFMVATVVSVSPTGCHRKSINHVAFFQIRRSARKANSMQADRRSWLRLQS